MLLSKQRDNDLQITRAETRGDIRISQLNIQREETCTGKPLANNELD